MKLNTIEGKCPNTKLYASIFLVVFIFFLILPILSSCSSLSTSNLQSLLRPEQNVIKLAYDIAENLEAQAFPPLAARNSEKPILSTSFVNNDNLNESSHFSRILQENIASRFVQMGYTVREIKLRNELSIEEQSGEIMLSRHLNDLRPSQKAQAVSLGTYSITGRVMYLTARLVDPKNANIFSSVDYKITMDDNMLAMFGMRLKDKSEENMIEEPNHSLVTRLLY